MRDDFNKPTREKLAHQAGYRCSKPDCGVSTRGAASDGDGTINVGFAAHITAASPDGPRFDSTLTSDQRKHHSNGIWLCGTHAKLIDSDESHFTVEELLSWKRLAIRRSFLEVVSSKLSPAGTLLTDDEDVQTAVDLLLDYSKSDLLAFQHVPGWPSHAIALNLKMVNENSTQVFTASGLGQAIEVFDEVAVIAPPGTGKTTTLLQLAEAILGNASSVAVFVPLSEWSTCSDTFFQSLVRRAAFRNARERQFELLTEHGRLVLILDGWNELDEVSKRRVRNDLKSLRRDFPDIHLVVSSRHKDFDIPIDGPVIEVDVLTEEQQLEIAKALRGSEGESLMDHAWRTSGLRELVAIPLYLTALLKQAPGGSLPTTKEEVLRSFVTELEKDPDKLATLREALQGFHRDFLEAIAVEATCQETVALSEGQARAVINTVQERLRDDRQIAQLLQPMKVVDSLVSAHLLVRSGAESGSVSFQHQQFQEWFTSFWVQQLMFSAASGDNNAKRTLREDVFDIPVWKETVLFACDRLSRADEGSKQAVAHAILETLGIDPLLSAEMIYRSSDEVWEQVREDVMSFAGKWHTEGRVDRAVKFMIGTGRAEFSQYIWPLISDSDNQVHLSALRSGRSFRPSVLGPDVQEWIATLPEEVRENVVSEIASNGGMDGIELAALLAKNDESAEVQKSVIESLLFRRADRFAKNILETAPDEVWRALAKKWHPNEFTDPDVSARMEKEAAELLAEETDSRQVLNTLLIPNIRDPEIGSKVRELVEHIDFSEKTQDNTWLVHRAHELYPEEVVGALVALLERGKPVPFRTDELLRASDVIIDDGPLVDCVLQNSGEGRTAETAVSIVGPSTVSELIGQMFEIRVKIKANNGRYDKTLGEEYHRLLDWISGTKIGVFIQTILERADTEDPDEVAILADLISRHGGSVERGPLRLDSAAHERATTAVQRWANVLLASPDATRAQFAEIAQAVERLESPALVPVLRGLLSEDLARRKRALEELAEARKTRRHIENDAHMCWTLQYRRAFAAIGDDQTVQTMKTYLPNHDFGIDAAYVLQAVWKKSQPVEDESGFIRSWHDFSVVPDEYTKRQSGAGGETHGFVNDILAVVDGLIKPGAEDTEYKHALGLATVAFSMPYVDKADTIASLLQLPLPTIDKRDLLTVLVLSGEAISSKIVLQGIDELLEEAKTNPWMLQEQNGWRLNAWLRLLSFTLRPGAILDVLDRLEGHQLEPWNLRELLSALSYAPSAEAENVLSELTKRDERFLNEYDWLAALTKRNTLTAARILLDLVCSASFPGKQDKMDFSKKLSAFMTSHEQFRKEVYERFLSVADGPAKSVLEYAIVDAADAEGVLLLVRNGAAQDKQFQTTALYTALRHVLVGQTPIESSGMQQLYSLPAPELRKGLFAMVVNGNAAEFRLATECLTAIDEIRDDYGHVDSEPRHPDIATGVPWPQIDPSEPT
ncbi:MAG: hypothetical protein KZQ98_14045 [Candidatus Thiodiazotropha sp. (ex Lucinoma borealis)]|nr:hypothetical protein [Candidatus Thiodiazotropha sp. (ex Lucinoma borealis)]